MIRPILLGIGLTAGVLLATQARSSPRTGFKAVNHVGIATSDIERSIRFYRDLIGMELEAPVSRVDDNPRYNHIFGLPKVRAKGAMLRLGTMQLELWEFEQPRGKAANPVQPVNEPRINHLCFEVADLQQEYERLKAAGISFHYPPQDFGGPKAVYARDPDGNVIELLELPR